MQRWKEADPNDSSSIQFNRYPNQQASANTREAPPIIRPSTDDSPHSQLGSHNESQDGGTRPFTYTSENLPSIYLFLPLAAGCQNR